jgi:hypothetical protein
MDQLVEEYRRELVTMPRSDKGGWQQHTGLQETLNRGSREHLVSYNPDTHGSS